MALYAPGSDELVEQVERATLIKRLSGQQRVLPLPAVLREAGL